MLLEVVQKLHIKSRHNRPVSVAGSILRVFGIFFGGADSATLGRCTRSVTVPWSVLGCLCGFTLRCRLGGMVVLLGIAVGILLATLLVLMFGEDY